MRLDCRQGEGALPLPLAGEGWGGGISAGENPLEEKALTRRVTPTSPARGPIEYLKRFHSTQQAWSVRRSNRCRARPYRRPTDRPASARPTDIAPLRAEGPCIRRA